MMKHFLVFCILFALVFGKVTQISKRTRSLDTEEVALEIEYLGTCKDFEQDAHSVRISTHRAGECLPLIPGGSPIPFKGQFIDPDAHYPDLNDLHCDYFCTDTEGPRALIHFVEIYDNSKTKVENYILSLVSSFPYRATNRNFVYIRRPTCESDSTFCGSVEQITNCTPSVIQFGAIMVKGKNFIDNAYVISKDRIYLTHSNKQPALCEDGNSCCSYIAPRSQGGMCPFSNGDFVLPFVEDYELHTTVDNHFDENLERKLKYKNPQISKVYKHKTPSHKIEEVKTRMGNKEGLLKQPATNANAKTVEGQLFRHNAKSN